MKKVLLSLKIDKIKILKIQPYETNMLSLAPKH